MKVMQAYNATTNESLILPQAPIAPPIVLPPSPVFETGESSHKTNLERHEEQIDTILNHLDEHPLKHIEQVEEKIKGHDDEIILARVRISTMEMIIKDIQVRHQSDMKSLLDKIYELKNHKGGPPDY
nr:hypothetical protein [Tanacetum cinerariifolium]